MVDETQTPQENESVSQGTEETSKANSGEGLSVIQSANQAAERAEKAAAALKAENDRKEKLAAENLLAGTPGAREENQDLKEETPKEYAEKVLAGDYND